MSSTEPPSRVPPRQQAHETKSARDELSSKGKVEKVREIDADEQTKKKRFMKYYRGIDEEENKEETARPSPFDLYSGKTSMSAEGGSGSSLGNGSPQSEFSDIDSSMIAGPAYTPPPNVNIASSLEGNDEATEGALPQSGNFWTEMSLPDQIQQPSSLQETPASYEGLYADKGEKTPVLSEHRKRLQEISKKEKDVGILKGKLEQKQETHEKLEKKKEERSLFGPPGKPDDQTNRKKTNQESPPISREREQNLLRKDLKSEKAQETSEWLRTSQEKPVDMRNSPPSKSKEQIKAKTTPFPTDEIQIAPRAVSGETADIPPIVRTKEKPPKKEEEIAPVSAQINSASWQQNEREGGGERQGREDQIHQIESPSLPQLPASVEPMATAATTQAASYLTPQTASLFFQMVGTIFVMQGPQAVNRTELILNNPAYADSRFYGSTITIEKYATAPDSFNIRLTGSQEAVVSFKENIPSLLAAFENGGFNFRIGRIDVEYSLERPLFRRKDKGEGRGETGGGDFGDRRDK